MDNDLTSEETELFGAYDLAAQLAVRCRHLHEMDVSVSASALELVLNTLMTELWDQGFSQAEIRKAYEWALADMPRYAARKD